MKIQNSLALAVALWMGTLAASAQEVTSRDFGFPISRFCVDDSARYLVVECADGIGAKDDHRVYVLEAATFRQLWNITIEAGESFHLVNGGLLVSEGSDTRLYGLDDGVLRWRNGRMNRVVLLSSDCAIGYQGISSSRFCGYSLATGERVWKTRISSDAGWSRVQRIDDDNFFIVADELYRLNGRTGELLTHECQPSIVDGKTVGGLIGMTAAAAFTAAFTGFYVISTPVDNSAMIYNSGALSPVRSDGYHIYNLCSDVVTQGDYHYFADRDHIFCLDTMLNVVWKTSLPARRASASRLFVDGDRIYMVNIGRGVRANKLYYATGRPFVAVFDRGIGQCLSYTEATSGDELAWFTHHDSCGTSFLFSDSLVQVLADGTRRADTLAREDYGSLRGGVSEPLYKFDDDCTGFVSALTREGSFLAYTKDATLFEMQGAELVPTDIGHIYNRYATVAHWPQNGGLNLLCGYLYNHDAWLADENLRAIRQVGDSISSICVTPRAVFLRSGDNELIQVRPIGN